MVVMAFEDKGDPNMRKNLQRVGAANDLSIEARVQVLQQQLAELITALEKAGIKTGLGNRIEPPQGTPGLPNPTAPRG
jgi:hypothetical protein